MTYLTGVLMLIIPLAALFSVVYLPWRFEVVMDHGYSISTALMLGAFVAMLALAAHLESLPANLSGITTFQGVLALLFCLNWRLYSLPSRARS